MSASKTGYGSASKSILTNAANTNADTTVLGSPGNPAYYTTTDSAGNFNITGDYTCNYNSTNPSQSDQLYILSLQGNATYIPGNPNTGGVNNPMIGLMAALGQCPSSGTFAGNIAFIYVNEVSTIATAYALAGFATNGSSIGSGSSVASQTGLANAFANAGQLYDIQGSTPSHEARLTTPGTGITGLVPQALLDTLANIIASCVNASNSAAIPTSGFCQTLYNNTGSAANTADAAIYIAQHPNKNIGNLYGLQTGAVPFGDNLATQPTDFSVGINFSGSGLSTPVDVAVDASGNAWVTSNVGKVSKLTPLGLQAAGSPFTVATANYVAIDQNGNAYVSSSSSNYIAELNSTGASVAGTPYTNGDFASPAGIAGDGNGNMFVANVGGSGLSNLFGLLGQYGDLIKINGTGSTATQTIYSNSLLYLGAELNQLPSVSQVAVDSSGYVWAAGDGLGCVALLLCTGQNVERLSGSNFTTAGVSFVTPAATCLLFCTNESPRGIAIDSSNNGWVAFGGTTNEVQKITAAGSATAYTGGGLNNPQGVAVDGSGHVWVANMGSSTISEFASTGTAITGATAYSGGTLSVPTALDLDQSGDLWVVNSTGNSVTEFIGLAAPTARPLAAAVANGTLATKP
jgi:sugar lactone lactonase YvrE